MVSFKRITNDKIQMTIQIQKSNDKTRFEFWTLNLI